MIHGGDGMVVISCVFWGHKQCIKCYGQKSLTRSFFRVTLVFPVWFRLSWRGFNYFYHPTIKSDGKKTCKFLYAEFIPCAKALNSFEVDKLNLFLHSEHYSGQLFWCFSPPSGILISSSTFQTFKCLYIKLWETGMQVGHLLFTIFSTICTI